jgi:CBS domain-containing protein
VPAAAVTVDRKATLRAAARVMHEAQVGALPVLDQEELSGILTERDIVTALATGHDPDRAEVGAFMSADPRYVTLADSVATAAETMLEVGCRHLPVVDEGVVIGIVSMRDVARAIA